MNLMIKEYNIEKSPLFEMKNRRKLAILLKLPENYFRTIHKYKYYKFYKTKEDGSSREINNPECDLKKIQKQLFKLLNRVKKPEWVISGTKGKSYVDNAKVHYCNDYICTMDIEKFYDSTKEIYVYNFFKNTLKNSTDIATILANLVTYQGKIPTGTPTSQLIAFWSYKSTFEKIYEICKVENIKFSLYVDDITLSSNMIINKKIKDKVNFLLNLKELNVKKKKTKFYSKNTNKAVTGAIIDKNNNIRLENKKRIEIINLYRKCSNPKTCSIEDLVKLNGKMSDAKQVENGIFTSISDFLKNRKSEINKYNINKVNKKLEGKKKNR